MEVVFYLCHCRCVNNIGIEKIMSIDKNLVLPVGTSVLCIKDCFADYDEADDDDELVWLYKKGREYTVTKQGFLIDEQGYQRQWKADWFTLSREFYTYFNALTD